jgi:predicted permease
MGNVVSLGMLYSAVLATGRAFFLGAIGIALFRKGILPPETQRCISKISYYVLIPSLLFTSIVNSATAAATQGDDVSSVEFLMLLFFPIVWMGIGMLGNLALSKLFGLDKLPFRFTIQALSSIANSLGLPLVFSSAVCEGTNSISALYSTPQACLTSMESYLGKYNIM